MSGEQEAQQAPSDLELERKRRKEAKAAEKAARKAAAKQRSAAKQKQPQKKAAAKPAKNEPRLRNTEFVNTVPKGEKKPVTTRLEDMAKTYDVAAVEAAWYEWWEAQGYFAPPAAAAGVAEGEEERFVMVIPPPNVTGALHLGHALTESIQDALVRWHRMSGRTTLWIPGSDHAGISCQDVVEKRLLREEGKSRHDFSREEFLAKIWQWREAYGSRITEQLRRLAISADWGRQFFTLDAPLAAAVQEAFLRLARAGLVYRDRRLVNWCCRLHTAISDIEVDHVELAGPTRMAAPGHAAGRTYPFGVLEHFAYRVAGGEEEVVVATTRIETMLGDSAVAVHPEDARYAHLHGARLEHPYFPGRTIPVVTDATAVKMEFGTGAVKITPAHDANDFGVGERHGLEFLTVFTDDGRMNDACPAPFRGMMRFDARVAIIDDLKARGLHRGTTPNPMTIGVCSRTGDIIEPLIKPQWWVDCKDMAARAVAAVENKELEIIPERHIKTWDYFLRNVRDWCVSRQLVWGHRIPAYFATVKGQPRPADVTDSWFIAASEEEARAAAAAKYGVAPEELEVEQDPDVLDTWFSSALLPFSTLGWPEDTEDFRRFFPGQLLETGHDILFFWVARMVMMSLQLTDQLPFKTVYLHAMVRDAFGKKMSKSKGNVVDPLDVIQGVRLADMHAQLRGGNLAPEAVAQAERGQAQNFPDGISECGTDALRFALCHFTSQGTSINLNINKVVKFRNFCNKLWNATRFAMMNLGDAYAPPASRLCQSGAELPVERWALARLSAATRATVDAFAAFDFRAATDAIHAFLLQDLCGVYLEAVKPVLLHAPAAAQESARNTLYTCLETGLRLLHPFMPFITEELWQRLPRRAADPASIMVAPYPAPEAAWDDAQVLADFDQVLAAAQALRALRATYGFTGRVLLPVHIRAHAPPLADCFRMGSSVIEVLCCAPTVAVLTGDDPAPKGCAVKIMSPDLELHVELLGHGLDLAKELKKLANKATKLERERAALAKRMAQPHYVERVPENVREDDQEKLDALASEIETTQNASKCLEDLVGQE